VKHTAPVLFDTVTARGGYRIGLLTLNRSAAMHALDLEMVQSIMRQMKRWERSKRVVAVLMRGAGDRAFSAGGDLRQLYESLILEGEDRYEYADQFFMSEYLNILQLHRFTKPLIAWGNGLVMGGGLGLYLAANHRVGTASLHLAWPEVRIGLFPDVLASWYLARLPQPLGLWMGLTGSALNCTDAAAAGLVQYQIDHTSQNPVIEDLRRLPWTESRAMNQQLVRQCLGAAQAESNISQFSRWLQVATLFANRLDPDSGLPMDNVDPDEQCLALDPDVASWYRSGLQQYQSGCPASARLVVEQVRRGTRMSQGEAVAFELGLAWRCSRSPDFAEGIRALLVDRDHQPAWQHSTPKAVPAAWLEQLLHSPWNEREHPFRQFLRYAG
jgi:enoyl-CoA hydratase/carnithine racemase